MRKEACQGRTLGMKLVKFAAAFAAAAGLLAAGVTVASAESTLEIVKKRG